MSTLTTGKESPEVDFPMRVPSVASLENFGWREIGIYSPLILAGISVFHLIRQPKYAISYVGLSIFNNAMNIWLKHWFRQPRPHIHVHDKTNRDYGMPSGHAQQIVFTLVFVWLVRPSWRIFWLSLTVGAVGVIERYLDRRHTLEQLCAGGVIGGAFAVVSVFMIRKTWCNGFSFEYPFGRLSGKY